MTSFRIEPAALAIRQEDLTHSVDVFMSTLIPSSAQFVVESLE